MLQYKHSKNTSDTCASPLKHMPSLWTQRMKKNSTKMQLKAKKTIKRMQWTEGGGVEKLSSSWRGSYRGEHTYRALLLSSSQPLDWPGPGWALLPLWPLRSHWGRATQNHTPGTKEAEGRKKERIRGVEIELQRKNVTLKATTRGKKNRESVNTLQRKAVSEVTS